jgi:succinyl-diaminopimelate desuccinylase
VTVISVPNTATNVIPGQAVAKLNIRYNDLWNRPKIESWVRDNVARAAAELGAKYDLSFSGTGDVFLTQPGPLVTTLTDAVKSVTGRTPALTTGGGTSDARFIKDICPVVEFGLVNATIHQVDEHTSIDDLEKLTEIYGRFISNFFRSG